MARFGTLAFVCFVLSVLLGSLLGEDAPGAGGDPELREYGERLDREVRALAEARFRDAREARERLAALHPALHHHASVEQVLTDLAADPALAPLARGIRAALERSDADASEVRRRWAEPDVQRAVVRTVTEALQAASEAPHAVEASAAPAPGG